ncbi:MAG TPA: hypothetical protein DCG75_13080 [Bacteroidales bacterium]|nr:hypothetical protein [Bacteroidales bacterium]
MKPLLEYGNYYHIYNRGNNYENIFIEKKDYQYFLKLLEIFIDPIADIYVWCLMKNHFHILVRIKEEKEIGYLNSENAKSENPEIKWKTYIKEEPTKEFYKKPDPTQQFKHLFNAYSRWFNIRHGRRGSLFEKNYERKIVNNQKQLINLILYIHKNPIKHGFVEHLNDYLWTSYHTIISEEPTNLKRLDVINYFDDLENFRFIHNFIENNEDNRFNDLGFD